MALSRNVFMRRAIYTSMDVHWHACADQHLPILFVCRSYILDQFIPYLTSFTLKGHQYQIEGHQ